MGVEQSKIHSEEFYQARAQVKAGANPIAATEAYFDASGFSPEDITDTLKAKVFNMLVHGTGRKTKLLNDMANRQDATDDGLPFKKKRKSRLPNTTEYLHPPIPVDLALIMLGESKNK